MEEKKVMKGRLSKEALSAYRRSIKSHLRRTSDYAWKRAAEIVLKPNDFGHRSFTALQNLIAKRTPAAKE